MTMKGILGAVLLLTTLSQVLGQGLGQWFQGAGAVPGNTGLMGNLGAGNVWNPGFGGLQGIQPNPAAMLPSQAVSRPAAPSRRQGYRGTAGRYPARGRRSAEELEYNTQMASSSIVSRNTNSEKKLTRRKRQAPGPAHMQAWDFHPSSLARARLQASLNERKPAALSSSQNSTGARPGLVGSGASVGPVRRHPTVLRRSQSGRRRTRKGQRPTLAAKRPPRPKHAGSRPQSPKPTRSSYAGNRPAIPTAGNPVLPTFNGRRSHHDTLFPNHPMDAHAQPPMKEMHQRQPIDQVRQPNLDLLNAQAQPSVGSSNSQGPRVIVRPKPPMGSAGNPPAGIQSNPAPQESPVVLMSANPSTPIRQESPVSVQSNPPMPLRQEPPMGMAPHPPMALRQEPPMGMAPHPPMTLRQDPPMGMAPHPPMALRQDPPMGMAPHPPMALRQDPPMGMAPHPPMALRQDPPMGMAPYPPMSLRQESPIVAQPNPPMPLRQEPPMGMQPIPPMRLTQTPQIDMLNTAHAQAVNSAGLTPVDPLYQVQGSVANDPVLFPNSEPNVQLLNDPSSQTILDLNATVSSQNTGAPSNQNLNIMDQQLLQQQVHEQHMPNQHASNSRPSANEPPRKHQQNRHDSKNPHQPPGNLQHGDKPQPSNKQHVKQGHEKRRPNHHQSPHNANQKHNQEMMHHQMLNQQFEHAPFDHQPQSRAKSQGPLSSKHPVKKPNKKEMQNPGSPIEMTRLDSNTNKGPVNRGIAGPLASKNLWKPIQNTGHGQPIHTDNHLPETKRNEKGISVKTWFIPTNFDLPIRRTTTQAPRPTRRPHTGNRASRVSGRRKAMRRRKTTTTTTTMPPPPPSTAMWWPDMNGAAATVPTTMWPTTMPPTTQPVTTTRKPAPRPTTRKPRPRPVHHTRHQRPRPAPVTRPPPAPTTPGLPTPPTTVTHGPVRTTYRPRPAPRKPRKHRQRNTIQHPPILKRKGWNAQEQGGPYRSQPRQRIPSGPFRTDNAHYMYDPSVPATTTTTSRMPTRPHPQVVTRPPVTPPTQPYVPPPTRPQSQVLTGPHIRPESQVVTRPRSQPHNRPQSQVVTRPRSQPQNRPQSQVVTRPRVQSQNRPQSQVVTRVTRPQVQPQARPKPQVVTRPRERPPLQPKNPSRQPSPIKYISAQNQVQPAPTNLPTAALPSNPAPATGSLVSQWGRPSPPSTMLPYFDATRGSAPLPQTTTRRPRKPMWRKQRRQRKQPARRNGTKRQPGRRQRQRRPKPKRPRPTKVPWSATTAITWERITAKSFKQPLPKPTSSKTFGSQWNQNPAPRQQAPTGNKWTPSQQTQKAPPAENNNLIAFLRLLANDAPMKTTPPPRPTIPAIPAAPLNSGPPDLHALPFLPAQSVQSVLPIQSALPVRSVQPVQSVLPVQSVQSVLPVQSALPIQSVLPVQSVQPAQSIKPVQSAQSVQNNDLFAILRDIAHGPEIKFPTPNMSSPSGGVNTTAAPMLGVTPVLLMPASHPGGAPGSGHVAVAPSVGQKNMHLLLDALAHNQQKTDSLNMIVMNLLNQAQHPQPQQTLQQQQTFDPTILNILSLGGGHGGQGHGQNTGGLGITNLLPEPRSCKCVPKTPGCPKDKKRFKDVAVVMGECGETEVLCCDDN